jgi:hypothetical protein
VRWWFLEHQLHQRDQMGFDDVPPRRAVDPTRWAVILVTVSVVSALAVARSQEPPLVSVEAQLARQRYPSVTPLEAIEPPPLDQLREVVIPDIEDGSSRLAHPDQEVASQPPPNPDDEKTASPEPPKPVQLSPEEKTQLFKDFQTLRSR